HYPHMAFLKSWTIHLASDKELPACSIGFQRIIFSIGTTKIPCAPAAFSCSIFSQNSCSLSTLCTLLQPPCASGNTVGLFIPVSREIIFCSELLGAFSNTYLL